MAKGHEQLIGFIPTIKKPDYTEALKIVAAQESNPNRQISCTFHAGEKNQHTRTIIPSRHVKHRMEVELAGLYEDMQNADFIQVIDLSDR